VKGPPRGRRATKSANRHAVEMITRNTIAMERAHFMRIPGEKIDPSSRKRNLPPG